MRRVLMLGNALIVLPIAPRAAYYVIRRAPVIRVIGRFRLTIVASNVRCKCAAY